MKKLQDKMAIVTGAGQGPGSAIAQAMVRESLVVCGINMEMLEHTCAAIDAEDVPCQALRCDVSDVAAVDATFAQATERFGAADILVNVRKINEKLLRGQCVKGEL